MKQNLITCFNWNFKSRSKKTFHKRLLWPRLDMHDVFNIQLSNNYFSAAAMAWLKASLWARSWKILSVVAGSRLPIASWRDNVPTAGCHVRNARAFNTKTKFYSKFWKKEWRDKLKSLFEKIYRIWVFIECIACKCK